ncbi:lipopolysaccharide biosynthesis protein [Sandaracinobacteroides saxicola]|nr:oligosaccharide flippase family protein [Sandaracinobacteroides saxicola]
MARPAPSDAPLADGAALAKGGRTSFLGFLLRLLARLPFIFIASRLYGAAPLGQFAYATMVVEFVAALALIGLKRGLAADMARGERPETHIIADGIALTMLLSALGVAVLVLFPVLMFPAGEIGLNDRLLALIVPAIVLSDLTLAALAYRLRIDAQVRARSVVEPWVLTLVAAALAFTAWKEDGLLIAYAASMVAAMLASVVPCWRLFGAVEGWTPSPRRLWRMARRNGPLAGADLVEWGTRRLDIFILGRFASAEMVGIYFAAQQLASLPQKIRSSFDAVLAPLLSQALARGDRVATAANLRQVGFWVLAFQVAAVLGLAFPGDGWMGLFGPAFPAGTMVMVTLLLVEVVASQASLAEAAMVYALPRLNFLLSAAAMLVQAALSLWLTPIYGGEGAALSLLVAVLLLACAKAVVLSRHLGASVLAWRWSLLLCMAPAALLGWLARGWPEWLMLAAGVPLILLAFGATLWRFGFLPADRLLFRRHPDPR